MIGRAHAEGPSKDDARLDLLRQYEFAIRRYLQASVRDADAVEEIFQEFSLKLVRGDFRGADQAKGRFRALVKTSLHHLIVDWYRAKKRQPQQPADDQLQHQAASDDSAPDPDEAFLEAWRAQLLEASWKRLQALQNQYGHPYHSVLRCRADFPEDSLDDLRKRLEVSGCPIASPGSLRVTLHRARKRFAAILCHEVKNSLKDPSDEMLESELIDLGLHHLVRM